MRMLSKLFATTAAVGALVAMTAGPALADPPSGTTPAATSIVGVGSDTIQNVMDQFSHDYNASHSKKLYSWDATNPSTGAIGDNITFKSGCTTEPRPDGSSAGITALATNLGGKTGGQPCEDFARSSRDRTATDPAYAAGGIAFDVLAGDAVTYATQFTTNAPTNLSKADLNAIYTCKDTNWDQVGGKNAPIKAFIPQSSSGTRAFFLTAIGITSGTPGSCVSDDNGNLEENEGVNPVLNGSDKADVIVPFSIGKFIAEKDHSAKCFNTACTAATSGANKGKICAPTGSQNLYGCNTHGTLQVQKINSSAPIIGSGASATINPNFAPAFVRDLFEVVRYSTSSGNVNHIPPYLTSLFGPTGWVCTNATAKADLLNYGFIVLKTCGSTH